MTGVPMLNETLAQEYRAGRLLTGQLKKKCIEILQDFVKGFQDVRSCSRETYRCSWCLIR